MTALAGPRTGVGGGGAVKGCGGFGGLALPLAFPGEPFPGEAFPFPGGGVRGAGGGSAMKGGGGPAKEGSARDGPAALAEPALASSVWAGPSPIAGTIVCVQPAPCNLGSVRRMSFAGPDIVTTKLERTTAQALTVQRGAGGAGLGARELRQTMLREFTCMFLTTMST